MKRNKNIKNTKRIIINKGNFLSFHSFIYLFYFHHNQKQHKCRRMDFCILIIPLKPLFFVCETSFHTSHFRFMDLMRWEKGKEKKRYGCQFVIILFLGHSSFITNYKNFLNYNNNDKNY